MSCNPYWDYNGIGLNVYKFNEDMEQEQFLNVTRRSPWTKQDQELEIAQITTRKSAPNPLS